MFRKFIFSPKAQDTDAIGDGVTGANFTLLSDGANDGMGHQIIITNNTANSHTGKTITVTGTDADDLSISETITGPDMSANVQTTKFFKTVTSVTPSASIGADTFDIGYTDDVVSKTVNIDHGRIHGIGLEVVVEGTINYDLQTTMGEVYKDKNLFWTDHVTIAAKSASFQGSLLFPVTGIRLLTNSVSGTATLTLHVVESLHK